MMNFVKKLILLVAKTHWKTTLAGVSGAGATATLAYASKVPDGTRVIAYVVAGALAVIGYLCSDKKTATPSGAASASVMTAVEEALEKAAQKAILNQQGKLLSALTTQKEDTNV